MAKMLRNLAVLVLLTTSATLGATQASGSGRTTRFWDCCKPSCSWPGKALVSAPVATCDINDQRLSDPNAVSGCNLGGSAYMCSDHSPWAVSDDLAYGFASVNFAGSSEGSWCCSCYELTFTSGPVAGKKMVVQATNTGSDVGNNQFDLAIPGGGVGLFNACTRQWNAPAPGWGKQYGGISSDTCSTFPSALQSGCGFRFGWFQGADNPTVDFKQVACPAALTAKTGCVREDSGAQYGSSSSASSSVAPSSSTIASYGEGSPSSFSSFSTVYASPSSASASPSSSSASGGYKVPAGTTNGTTTSNSPDAGSIDTSDAGSTDTSDSKGTTSPSADETPSEPSDSDGTPSMCS